jgi:ADP-heptose:LPS heptosyltransferase
MIYEWLPLLNMPDINLINLQYGDIQSDICVARVLSDNTIHHWNDSDPLMDMDFFAAQISALDLVISVDNSTVHLAGALGVKTWVLQPFSPDWRWLDNSSNSHWYPSVSQFHPSAHGKWDSVISSVANHLMKLVASQ